MGWPVVALGEVVRHRKEFVTIEPDKTYSRCRVQTSARGIVLRDRVPGDAIKTKKQQVCRAGEFLVAEIDAKLGGYGIVPDELDGAIVSSHYFLFEVEERHLLRRFLHWYCQTSNFLEQVNARGSTNYAAIRPGNVLTYTIPLPSLAEQHRIVAKLDKVAALVAERSKVIETAERDAKAMLSNAFRQIIDDAPYRPMAEVAPLVRRPVEIEPDQRYPELGVRSFGRGTFHKPALDGMSVGSKKLFRIHDGRFALQHRFRLGRSRRHCPTRGRRARWLTPLPHLCSRFEPRRPPISPLLLSDPGRTLQTRRRLPRRRRPQPYPRPEKLDAITVPVPPLIGNAGSTVCRGRFVKWRCCGKCGGGCGRIVARYVASSFEERKSSYPRVGTILSSI